MKNTLWGTISYDNSPIFIILFISRKKDNEDIENFIERRESFISHENETSSSLQSKFLQFVNKGVKGEVSRMYISVNERDSKKIYKNLLHFLIDNPDFNLCSMQPKLAGIAANKECARTKHWMFDFDNEDDKLLMKFIEDIHEIDPTIKTTVFRTPHGYSVIADRGFDCRKLLEEYNYVTLKRDDLVCIRWEKKLL